jgi:hypothetical protein
MQRRKKNCERFLGCPGLSQLAGVRECSQNFVMPAKAGIQ